MNEPQKYKKKYRDARFCVSTLFSVRFLWADAIRPHVLFCHFAVDRDDIHV